MGMWIDQKYALMLDSYVRNFKVKQHAPLLINFSCPICGDSTKNLRKARGYLYVKENKVSYKCHNCGDGRGLSRLLKEVNYALYKEYVMEKYSERGLEVDKKKIYDFKPPSFDNKSTLDRMLARLSDLPEDNLAVQYAKSRKLPKYAYNRFYYIDDIQKLKSLANTNFDQLGPRMLIPFYNRQQSLVGVSCRDLSNESKIKYLNVKISKNDPMIYNIDNIDMSKTIYVVEGPLDSLFFPNCVAVGTSDLLKVKDYLPKDKCVLIPDLQPRNKEIVKLTSKFIDNNYKVCLLPNHLPGKDINEIILSGVKPKELFDIVTKNTFNDIQAKMEFIRWKKI